MFSFLDYEREIMNVSADQKVDMGVAYDKFRADVKLGHADPDNTGNSLPWFDFAAAKEKWDALDEAGQLAAYHEWHTR